MTDMMLFLLSGGVSIASVYTYKRIHNKESNQIITKQNAYDTLFKEDILNSM